MAKALLISIGLNSILLGIAFSIDPIQGKRSGVEAFVDSLLSPAWGLTEWLAPGHDLEQILVAVMFSLVFYACIAWVALSLWTLFRRLTSKSAGGPR